MEGRCAVQAIFQLDPRPISYSDLGKVLTTSRTCSVLSCYANYPHLRIPKNSSVRDHRSQPSDRSNSEHEKSRTPVMIKSIKKLLVLCHSALLWCSQNASPHTEELRLARTPNHSFHISSYVVVAQDQGSQRDGGASHL